jgi:predicted acetyltransferase
LQNARRDARLAAGQGKWSTSIDDELNFIVKDFRQAGFGGDVVKQVLKQNYRMLDDLGVKYIKPAGF